MEDERTAAKRQRHGVISKHVYTEALEESLRKHWCSYGDVKSKNLEVISKPFRVCKISNFLASEEFMDGLKNELLDVKCRRNIVDLYQFEQTGDLAFIDSRNLQLLYSAFQNGLATWMERNTKIELNNKISMSSSCYCDTDYLLCHDDNMGERRIAYVLYLSKDWTAADGGALELFDVDENNLPRNVTRTLVPEYNSLIFFEVTDDSYHQVAEVTSAEKCRWTINGWFEGPARQSLRLPRPEPVVRYVEPLNVDVDLSAWLSECYLYPNVVMVIHENIEQDSYTFLSDFLRDDVCKRLAVDITSDCIDWRKAGPADVRNYELADEETLPAFLRDFYNMFKSFSFFQLLKDYTELDLVPVVESMKPKMTIELQRWSKGSYTLICDKKEGTTEDKTIAVKISEEEFNIVGTSKASKNGEKSECNDLLAHSKLKRSAAMLKESKAYDRNDDYRVPAKRNHKTNSPRSDRDSPLNDKEYEEDFDDEEDATKRYKKNKLKKLEVLEEEPLRRDAKKRYKKKKKKKSEEPEVMMEDDDDTEKGKDNGNGNGKAQSSSSNEEGSSPTSEDNLDRDDSEVSDIDDYLSDPLDYLDETRSDDIESESKSESESDREAVLEPGALDVIMQFHVDNVPEQQTIDYVDPKEKDGALIHVPPKDNHLCLVYKTLSTCRVHKYVNHYCKDYFYNLVCTYYE